MDSYIDGDATVLEITSARLYHALNGYEPWDAEENFVIMLVRPIGWGLRGAMHLFCVLFCFLSLTKQTNPIFYYGFSRERDSEGTLHDDSSDVFEWYVYCVYILWVLSIASEAFSYLVGRYSAVKPRDSDACTAVPWVFFNRSPVDAGCGVILALTVWFLGLAASAAIVAHTVVSHSYVKRNHATLWLFAALVGCTVAGTVADALSIGGPTGIRASSKGASWLASLRVVVLVPMLFIFSCFFVWLCLPDLGEKLDCVECNSN
jgi:hypothetical protein